jgi:hypothetical protein
MYLFVSYLTSVSVGSNISAIANNKLGSTWHVATVVKLVGLPHYLPGETGCKYKAALSMTGSPFNIRSSHFRDPIRNPYHWASLLVGT